MRGWADFRDGRAAGTPILEDGMQYVPVGSTVSPADSKDIEGRQLTDVEVCSAFHIPPELVGARQGTFSNISAFRSMLFGPTLGPQFTQFEEAFNSEVVPALDGSPGIYAELDREAAMRSAGVEALCRARAEDALAIAQSTAPVDTGDYRGGLAIEKVPHRYRDTYEVVGHDRKTLLVESRTGNLARALKAVRKTWCRQSSRGSPRPPRPSYRTPRRSSTR